MKQAMYTLLILMACVSTMQGQNVDYGKYGKGIQVKNADNTFSSKIQASMQVRADMDYNQDTEQRMDRMRIRRSRLKFDGHAFDPKLSYKIQYEMVSSTLLDAVFEYELTPTLSLAFGQTKLPGNREELISSTSLQMVDRSAFNSAFGLGRDKGLQLIKKQELGSMAMKFTFSVAQGEGIDFTGFSQGMDYAGRIELMPFGVFQSKGEYSGADLVREKSPKLAVALAYDYNAKAMREQGQKGSFTSGGVQNDLSTLFLDMMFKYNGFSLMGEWAVRDTKDPASYAQNRAYYTGSGYNAQAGYLLARDWEISARYTQVDPTIESGRSEVTEVTGGLSKYFVHHSLKIQGDLGQNTVGNTSTIAARIQMAMIF